MIFIIIGDTCVGKSTLMNFAMKEYKLSQIKQFTTRKRRNKNDNEYIFVSLSSFNKTDYVNIKKYNSNYYGVTKESIKNADTDHKILITDYATAKKIKKESKAEIIYLRAPLYARVKRIWNKSNARNKKRILLDIFYFWEIFLADKVIYNNKGILDLECKARDYFDEKIKYT